MSKALQLFPAAFIIDTFIENYGRNRIKKKIDKKLG